MVLRRDRVSRGRARKGLRLRATISCELGAYALHEDRRCSEGGVGIFLGTHLVGSEENLSRSWSRGR